MATKKARKTKDKPETEIERLSRIVGEREAAARYSFKHGLQRENENDRANLVAARFNLADRLARDLGHVPLKQGMSYECMRCDASGTFDVAPIGAIFAVKCGR